MRTLTTIVTLPILALALAASAWAGPLNPPAGPIAATAKPLSEIEPRTAINTANTPGDATSVFKITQPGSYFLTGNVTGTGNKNAITIAASRVTIDLNGFTLTGTGLGTTGAGIRTTVGVSSIRISNGHATNWGTSGITLGDADSTGSIIENVTSSDNAGDGFSLGIGSTARSCVAENNGVSGFSMGRSVVITGCIADSCQYGFYTSAGCSLTGCSANLCSVNGFLMLEGSAAATCTAQGCGQMGFYAAGQATLENCIAYSTTAGPGFFLYRGASIRGSVSAYNNQDGITANNACAIENCNCYENGDDGVQVADDCVVRACTFRNNGYSAAGAGVYITGFSNRVEDNQCYTNHTGVLAGGGGNFIVRNTASNNVANYNFLGFQNAAPVIVNPGVNGFAGATPFSNFSI